MTCCFYVLFGREYEDDRNIVMEQKYIDMDSSAGKKGGNIVRIRARLYPWWRFGVEMVR